MEEEHYIGSEYIRNWKGTYNGLRDKSNHVGLPSNSNGKLYHYKSKKFSQKSEFMLTVIIRSAVCDVKNSPHIRVILL
jgi:hypothetical protein